MKVIDLLNKIANGEESDLITEFEFDKRVWNFFKLQDSEFCIDGWLLNQEIVITKHKEIIEEDKKIEKLPYYDYGKIMASNNKLKTMELMLEKHEKRLNDNWGKINELIDEVNKLKEKE